MSLEAKEITMTYATRRKLLKFIGAWSVNGKRWRVINESRK
jgi:hypothetical protein